MSNHAAATTAASMLQPPQASPRALTPSAIRARLEAQSAASHSNSPASNSSANSASSGSDKRGEQQRHQRKLSQVAYGSSKASAQSKTNSSATATPSPASEAAAQLLRGAHSASPPQLQPYNKHATLPADFTKVSARPPLPARPATPITTASPLSPASSTSTTAAVAARNPAHGPRSSLDLDGSSARAVDEILAELATRPVAEVGGAGSGLLLNAYESGAMPLMRGSVSERDAQLSSSVGGFVLDHMSSSDGECEVVDLEFSSDGGLDRGARFSLSLAPSSEDGSQPFHGDPFRTIVVGPFGPVLHQSPSGLTLGIDGGMSNPNSTRASPIPSAVGSPAFSPNHSPIASPSNASRPPALDRQTANFLAPPSSASPRHSGAPISTVATLVPLVTASKGRHSRNPSSWGGGSDFRLLSPSSVGSSSSQWEPSQHSRGGQASATGAEAEMEADLEASEISPARSQPPPPSIPSRPPPQHHRRVSKAKKAELAKEKEKEKKKKKEKIIPALVAPPTPAQQLLDKLAMFSGSAKSDSKKDHKARTLSKEKDESSIASAAAAGPNDSLGSSPNSEPKVVAAWKFWRKERNNAGEVSPQTTLKSALGKGVTDSDASLDPASNAAGSMWGPSSIAATMPSHMPSHAAASSASKEKSKDNNNGISSLMHIRKAQTMPAAGSSLPLSLPNHPPPLLKVAVPSASAAADASAVASPPAPRSPNKNKSPNKSPNNFPMEYGAAGAAEGRIGGHKRQKSAAGDDVHSPRSGPAFPLMAGLESIGSTPSSPQLAPRSLGSVVHGGDKTAAAQVGLIDVTLGADICESAESTPPGSPVPTANCYDDSAWEVPPALLDLKSPRPPPALLRGVQALSSWTKTTFFPHAPASTPAQVRMEKQIPSALRSTQTKVSPEASPVKDRPTMSAKAAALLGLGPSQFHNSASVSHSTASTVQNSAASSAATSAVSSPRVFPVPRSQSLIMFGSKLTSPQLSPALIPTLAPNSSPQFTPLCSPSSVPGSSSAGPTYSELRSIISGHGSGYLLFLRHLQREYAAESLLFWKAMEDFLPLAARDVEQETAKAAAAAADAQPQQDAATDKPASEKLPSKDTDSDLGGFSLLYLSLYNMYIKAGSKFEINISSSLRAQLKKDATSHEVKLARSREARGLPPQSALVARGLKVQTAHPSSPPAPCNLDNITPMADEQAQMEGATLYANPLMAFDSIASSPVSNTGSQTARGSQDRISKYLVRDPTVPTKKHSPGARSRSLFVKRLSVVVPPAAVSALTAIGSPSMVARNSDVPHSDLASPRQAAPSCDVSELVLAEMSADDADQEAAPRLSPVVLTLTSGPPSSSTDDPESSAQLAWRTYQHLLHAQKEIENLLVQDCLPRFKHSPLWSKYVAATSTSASASPVSSSPPSAVVSPLAKPMLGSPLMTGHSVHGSLVGTESLLLGGTVKHSLPVVPQAPQRSSVGFNVGSAASSSTASSSSASASSMTSSVTPARSATIGADQFAAVAAKMTASRARATTTHATSAAAAATTLVKI